LNESLENSNVFKALFVFTLYCGRPQGPHPAKIVLVAVAAPRGGHHCTALMDDG